jgi:predicted NBD/HSP70 family sugar kinase
MPSANTRVAAGVDLGGTKIQTVAVRDEQVVGSARVPTPQTGDATDGHRCDRGDDPRVGRPTDSP